MLRTVDVCVFGLQGLLGVLSDVCMYVHLFQILREGAKIITGIPIHCKSYTRCGRRGGGGEGEEEGKEGKGNEKWR